MIFMSGNQREIKGDYADIIVKNETNRIKQELLNIMKEKGMIKSDLARMTGVHKANVTKWFYADKNLTLTTLIKITTALGYEIKFNKKDKKPIFYC